MTEADVLSWAGLLLRWLHVITGIAWIGSSFYFVWLDNSLEPVKGKDGASGELWAVHGGGFYHKKKYPVAPAHMPEHLHWFKWEAYATWVSGFLLLALVYYYGASVYLVDAARAALTPFQAVFTGLCFLGGGWVFYDELCKSSIGRCNRLFGFIWFASLTAAGWGLFHVFSGRGAAIHLGAMIGTVMVANVFFVIIPNQRKVVAALLAGEKPDPALGQAAKQRSLHNNYMTLPVLLVMISNHYPMLYGGENGWLVLAAMAAAAWPIRHFFNLKHKGKVDYRYLLAGAVGIITIAFAVSGGHEAVKTDGKVTAAEVRQIVRTHCSACHSDTPVHEGFSEPPQGVAFDTMDEIKRYAARIAAQAVETETMPLGNETGMTAAERERLGEGLKNLP